MPRGAGVDGLMLRWIAPDPTFTYLIIFLSFSQFGNSYLGHAGIEKQPPAIHRLETSTHRNSRTSGSCRRPALFVAQYSTSMLYTSPTVIPRSSSSSWRLRRRSLNASAPWGKKSGRTEPRQTPPDYQKKRRIHARNVNKRTIREGGNNQGGRARPPRDTIREGGRAQSGRDTQRARGQEGDQAAHALCGSGGHAKSKTEFRTKRAKDHVLLDHGAGAEL